MPVPPMKGVALPERRNRHGHLCYPCHRPVKHLAAEMGVSRKFAYRQAARAEDALDTAFFTVEVVTPYALVTFYVPEAAKVFPISDTQLRMWVRRYDAGGLEGLRDRPRRGRPPILDPEKEETFSERVRIGPAEAEGLAAYRGEDVQRLLKDEFGSDYSISGTYFLLHRLGFSNLVPRPVHPKADPAAQAAFKKGGS